MARYRAAIDPGLLKIMSKMGISVISSYRGGLNFEAVGLSRAMVAEYFPGMTSRISGHRRVAASRRSWKRSMRKGWRGGQDVLPIGGFYKARRSGETHAWEAHDDAHAANGVSPRVLRDVEAVFGQDAGRTRRSICAICWTSSRWARRCRSKRWKASPRSASGS